MRYAKPITELIQRRFSCRTYQDKPIEEQTRQKLADRAASLRAGPLGAPARLQLMAATEEQRGALRGLGTYGIIRHPSGFLVGAVAEGSQNLEDFGYLTEDWVLFATSLGLGTCWLGGTFNRSAFANKLALRPGEVMPAVVAVGYISDQRGLVDRMIRRGAGSSARLPWEQLFFDEQFGKALTREQAGPYAVPLEMLRLAPSASNKQPWRVVRQGSAFHLYLQRTPGYGQARLVHLPDLQRVDLGIAMCHFDLTARELGMAGEWQTRAPERETHNGQCEYVITWQGQGNA